MADIIHGAVNIAGGNARSTSKMETIGRTAANLAAETVNQEENPYSELNHRVEKTLAVASLVTGSFGQNQAAAAYDKMNFKDDAYLKEIGVSAGSNGAQRKLDSYLNEATFAASSKSIGPSMQEIGRSESSTTYSLNTITHPISGEERSQIQSSGILNVGGVDYKAKLDGNNVTLTSFGATFDDTQKLKVDIDPLKGITSIDASVKASSFSKDEIESIKNNKSNFNNGSENYDGRFTRAGVTYDVKFDKDPSRAYIHATADSTRANVMLGAVNKPMVDTTFTMKGSALSGQRLNDAARTGEYKLGGMTFSALKGFNADQYRAMSASASNANANAMRDISAHSKAGKAKAVASIQQAGISHIRKQSDFLDKNFNGSKDSLKKCQNSLKRQLAMEKDSKKKEALKNQLDLLKQYDKHGGKISNPSVNPRKTAGMMAVGNAVLGQDMMRGVGVYVGAIKAAKLTARATTAVSAKLAYMGSSTANKLVSKGMGKIKGVDNKVSTRLNAIQKKKDKLYQDRKDKARARKNGTMKQYKRRKKDEKWAAKGAKFDRKNDRLSHIRGKYTTQGGTADKVLGWRQKRNAQRKDRYNRISNFRESVRKKLDVKGRIKSKISNSKLGKAWGGLKNSKFAKVISAPFKGIKGLFNLGAMIKKILIKIVFIGIAAYMMLFLMFCAPLLASYIFSRFFSIDVRLEDALNSAFNYQQMIVDEVNENIAFDYKIICQIDATNHYLSKRQLPSEKYPWYVAPKFGSIEHQWAWEESDNTSRYLEENDTGEYDNYGRLIGSGDFMYKDTYIPQADRTEIDSITFNLYPIVAMSHMRYHDEFSFEQWESVLGYTYYMFAVSHDISKYDTDQSEYHRVKEYGDDEYDPGYDYEIITCENENLYGNGIEWDTETHSLYRSNEVCSNVYIHDFSPIGYENDMRGIEAYRIHNVKNKSSSYSAANVGEGSVLDVASAAGVNLWRSAKKAMLNLTKKLQNNGDQTDGGDAFDKGYTDVNSALTLTFRRKALKYVEVDAGSIRGVKGTLEATIEALNSKYGALLDFNKNMSGIFLYDGTEESLPHAQTNASELNVGPDGENELNGLGEVCDNYLEFPYGNVVDTFENREEDLWMTDEGGTCDHVHVLTCHRLKCGKTDGYETDPVTGQILYDNYGQPYEHHHSESCYDTTPEGLICGHHHEPWAGKDSPGCWKTVCICAGHCGSHIDPKVNIVQKVTYKGLADDDNFKTTYWLTIEEINGVGGALSGGMFEMLNSFLTNENDIVTVAKFRSYWYAKVTQWFRPMPRSPWGFYKKLGENYIVKYLEACDGFIDAIEGIFTRIFGTAEKNEKKTDGQGEWTQSMEETDDSGPDKWQWEGWWQERHVFDESLFDEVSTFYGSWEEDQYKASEEWWKEETSGEAHVDFPKMGIGGVIYSEEEIEAIVQELINIYQQYAEMSGLYNELSEQQIAILKAGLSRCGTFSYSLSGGAHINAIKNNSGSGDCSGWVSGTLSQALGKNFNASAAGYASMGVYGGAREPGCVIAHNNGGSGYTGHVMIYVGYMSNGPQGAGTYVMDCSSSVGGSSLRKMSEETLDKRYPYTYKPW